MPAAAPAVAAEKPAAAESENKVEAEDNESSPRKSGRKVKPTEKVLEVIINIYHLIYLNVTSYTR